MHGINEEDVSINVQNLITLRQAGKILEIDQRIVKGIAIGLRIKLVPAAGALFMTRDDFARVKAHLETDGIPAGK